MAEFLDRMDTFMRLVGEVNTLYTSLEGAKSEGMRQGALMVCQSLKDQVDTAKDDLLGYLDKNDIEGIRRVQMSISALTEVLNKIELGLGKEAEVVESPPAKVSTVKEVVKYIAKVVDITKLMKAIMSRSKANSHVTEDLLIIDQDKLDELTITDGRKVPGVEVVPVNVIAQE